MKREDHYEARAKKDKIIATVFSLKMRKLQLCNSRVVK